MKDKEQAKQNLNKIKQCILRASNLPLSIVEIDAMITQIDAALTEEKEPKKGKKK
jgi:hypothetical protein